MVKVRRLHVFSTHTRVAMQAKLGHVFSFQSLTIGRLLKARLTCSAVNQGTRRIPSFFTPLARRMQAAKSAVRKTAVGSFHGRDGARRQDTRID